MQRSVAAGELVTLNEVSCAIDGLKVKRVGTRTFEIVRDFVDEVVALDDDTIFDSMLWMWSRCKLVVEGAAAAPVAAIRNRSFDVPAGTNVACVLSGGNVDLDPIRGRVWN
jgi:threonine dehydratase